MKQISQNYKTGVIRLEEVDPPALKTGGILVQSAYSLISSGTESMKVREGQMSYLGKARARPDQVKKVLETLRQQGPIATYQKVMNRLDKLTPLGYSLSGTVIEVDPQAGEFAVGQAVACGGAEYANHSEINFIPKNLAVPVPADVPMHHAAFTTIGAIAMQGFRQAQMQLGETACVIGLGLLGQILIQLLRAAGVQAVGVDLIPGRCQLAMQCGAVSAGQPDDAVFLADIVRLTRGAGVDCVFITAGGSSNEPVELAAAIARDRARIVDIGKTRLDLPWKEYYGKELDVRFSRSYGPGRYDPNYEGKGVDYPIGYVRWTERRNMQSFLDLLASGLIDLEPIVTGIFPFDEAEQVYADIAEGKDIGLGIVFKYADQPVLARTLPVRSGDQVAPVKGKVRIGVIGAGNYASSMLLPHLKADNAAVLVEVATATSLSAANAKQKFGFKRTSTDYQSLLAAEDIDAVVIATRHASHPRMVGEALRAGKPVFVEKPLAVDLDGVSLVHQAIAESGNSRLQVGFNRRFAPLVQELAAFFARTSAPLVVNYRVHAGQMASDSWYLDVQHGTRFAGEAGHFLDVIAYLTGSRPVAVTASALRPSPPSPDDLENIAVTVEYEDGSLGVLIYLTQGSPIVPKESIEVFGGGLTAHLDNFNSVTFYGSSRKKKTSVSQDKGQKNQMRAFVEAIRTGGPMPIPIDSLFDTTLVTLAAQESIRSGQRILLDEYRPF